MSVKTYPAYCMYNKRIHRLNCTETLLIGFKVSSQRPFPKGKFPSRVQSQECTVRYYLSIIHCFRSYYVNSF